MKKIKNIYNWNVVFRKVIEIKERYIEKFGESNIVNTITRYYIEFEGKVSYYYTQLLNQLTADKKEAMIWINENVPKKYQSYVRNIYLGIKIDYLVQKKGSQPQYIKYKYIQEYLGEEQSNAE